MESNVFDHSLRMLECGQCGAPLTVPPQGGTITCSYCGATMVLAGRVAETTSLASPLPEPQRIEALRAQLGYVGPNRYDVMRAPAELRSLLAHGWMDSIPGLREAWLAAKARLSADPSVETQFAAYWIVLMLSQAYAQAHEDARRRAVLEGALETLPDPGHRHSIRCNLVRAAARVGDQRAAEGWLAQCEPRPGVLELDTEYRIARASIELFRNNPAGMLELVGAGPDDVPLSLQYRNGLASQYRIDAHEKLGHDDVAYGLLRAAITLLPKGEFVHYLASNELAPRTRLRWEATGAKEPEPKTAPSAGSAVARPRRNIALVVVLLAAVSVAIMGAGVYFAMSTVAGPTVGGSFHSAGGELGTWDMVPDTCVSAEKFGHNGADIYSEKTAGKQFLYYVRFVDDPASPGRAGAPPSGERSLHVFIPGTSQSIAVPAKMCHVFDGQARRTNVKVDGVLTVDGSLRVDCEINGGRIQGSLTFEGCH